MGFIAEADVGKQIAFRRAKDASSIKSHGSQDLDLFTRDMVKLMRTIPSGSGGGRKTLRKIAPRILLEHGNNWLVPSTSVPHQKRAFPKA